MVVIKSGKELTMEILYFDTKRFPSRVTIWLSSVCYVDKPILLIGVAEGNFWHNKQY